MIEAVDPSAAAAGAGGAAGVAASFASRALRAWEHRGDQRHALAVLRERAYQAEIQFGHDERVLAETHAHELALVQLQTPLDGGRDDHELDEGPAGASYAPGPAALAAPGEAGLIRWVRPVFLFVMLAAIVALGAAAGRQGDVVEGLTPVFAAAVSWVFGDRLRARP